MPNERLVERLCSRLDENVGWRVVSTGPLTDAERYAFDLRGYLVRRHALDHHTVRRLRAAVDELRLPSPGPTIQSQRFRDHLRHDAAFRDLIDHPAIADVVIELCGPTVRLDHTYGIVMGRGTSGLGLHGGGTPHDPAQYYRVEGGRIFSGLVAVQWSLVDHRVGDGGFGCIPGSHKANFGLPADLDRRMVVETPMAAGDVIVFTEALTHCTIPWRGRGDRLTLLYKYGPGHLAWSPGDPGLVGLEPLLTDRQRRFLQKPAVHGHLPIVDPGSRST